MRRRQFSGWSTRPECSSVVVAAVEVAGLRAVAAQAMVTAMAIGVIISVVTPSRPSSSVV